MRGEHKPTIVNLTPSQGSSPHARGTLMPSTFAFVAYGIIPACAGNTGPPCQTIWDCRDHPRMRGEHPLSLNCLCIHMGSSPHARGTHLHVTTVRHQQGIIPACAGNTMFARFNAHWPGDHPRMRGEHRQWITSELQSQGSSPHARGTLLAGGAVAGDDGIIPACAGNTYREIYR